MEVGWSSFSHKRRPILASSMRNPQKHHKVKSHNKYHKILLFSYYTQTDNKEEVEKMEKEGWPYGPYHCKVLTLAWQSTVLIDGQKGKHIPNEKIMNLRER